MSKRFFHFFGLYLLQIKLANSYIIILYPVECKDKTLNVGTGLQFGYLELSILEASGKIAQKDKVAPPRTSAPMNLMN